MYCGNCKNLLPEGATICPHCGVPIAPVNVTVDIGKKEEKKFSKKNGKIILFIILGMLLLAIGGGIGYFIGHRNNIKCVTEPKELSNKIKDETKETEEVKEDEEKTEDSVWEKKPHPEIDISNIKYVSENDYSKNIEILNCFYLEKQHYIEVYGINNGKENLNYTIYLNYIDANGKRVDRTLDLGYVEAGKKFVASLDNSTSDEFTSVTISVSADKYKSYYHSVKVDEKKLIVSEKDTSINALYKNESNVEHSLYMGIVYYKNGKVVHVSKGYAGNIKPGLSGSAEFYFSSFPEYEYGKSKSSDFFDKYEIFISAAFYYDTEY